MKENKPRGWANLQQQLREIRNESFKQGIWEGRKQLLKEFKENIEMWENMTKEQVIEQLKYILKEVKQDA